MPALSFPSRLKSQSRRITGDCTIAIYLLVKTNTHKREWEEPAAPLLVAFRPVPPPVSVINVINLMRLICVIR